MKHAYIYIVAFAALLFASCSIGVDLEPDPKEGGASVKESVWEEAPDNAEEVNLNSVNK